MSRKEFIDQLEKLLMDIPPEERVEALEYYNGYFEDAGVENEERIIRELESPQKVAKIIKTDIGVEEKKEDKTSKIILLVLLAIVTSPLWIGIIGGAGGVIIGAAGTIFGIAVALAAVVFALYVTGLVLFGVGASLLFAGNFALGIALLGGAFLVLALAVFGTIGCVWLFGKFCPWLVKSIVSLCSRLIHREEKTA